MTRREALAAAALLACLPFLSSCPSPAAPQEAKPPSGRPVPESTAVGEAVGAPASATVGPAGGTLSSPDGRATLTVPAGALAADTEVALQPIYNLAFGGLGLAYRLLPAGLGFAKSARLSFSATAADGAKASLGLRTWALQDKDGYWSRLGGAGYDEAAGTVSAAVDSAGDFAPAALTAMKPLSAKLKPGASLKLSLCKAYPLRAASGPDAWRGFRCGDWDFAEEEARDWAVAGIAGGDSRVGTVSGSAEGATYTAPAKRPAEGSVYVSARLFDSGLPQLSKIEVYCLVEIEEAGDYKGRVSIGQSFGGLNYGVAIDPAELVLKDDGPDEANYELRGKAVIAPAILMIGGQPYTLASEDAAPKDVSTNFKVLKTNPPTVRWGYVETWIYRSGESAFPATVNFDAAGMGSGGDVAVESLDKLDGKATSGSAGYSATAEWELSR